MKPRQLLRVTAPQFVAQAVYEKHDDEWWCIHAEPRVGFLKHMRGSRAQDYVARKGWKWEWVPVNEDRRP